MSDRKRMIGVRVTPAELRKIKAEARRRGYPSVSAYVRKVLGLPVVAWRPKGEK